MVIRDDYGSPPHRTISHYLSESPHPHLEYMVVFPAPRNPPSSVIGGRASARACSVIESVLVQQMATTKKTEDALITIGRAA